MIKKIVTLFLLSLSFHVSAKDLTHRLGVGFKNNTAQDIPSLAAIYHFDKDLSTFGGVGLDTQKNASTFQAHVGLRQNIYFENNLNYYWGGQVGLISFETAATGRSSGLELQGLLGVEFFFAGLENLAFIAEGGLGLTTASETRIRTLANSPLKAGILFYF